MPNTTSALSVGSFPSSEPMTSFRMYLLVHGVGLTCPVPGALGAQRGGDLRGEVADQCAAGVLPLTALPQPWRHELVACRKGVSGIRATCAGLGSS